MFYIFKCVDDWGPKPVACSRLVMKDISHQFVVVSRQCCFFNVGV